MVININPKSLTAISLYPKEIIIGIKLMAINNAANLVNAPSMIKTATSTWKIAIATTTIVGCIGIKEGTKEDHISGSKILVIPNQNKVNPKPNLKINEL